jgi:hypothetical protein
MKPEDFDLLLERHLDGDLSADEAQSLALMLEQHEWAQDRFVERMALSAALHGRLSAELTLTETPPSVDEQRLSRSRPVWFGLVAAVAIAVMAYLFNQGGESRAGVTILAAEEVGTLDSQALADGRPIRLARGLLELELNNESRVVVEGPAEFRVVSAKHVRLESGRCFAEMEKGKSGLRIETPAGDVLDLGTKFAVDVSTGKQMSVHVFDGKVEVSSSNKDQQLTAGEGILVATSGETELLDANSQLFIPRVPRALAEDTPYLRWSFDEADGDDVQVVGRGLDLSLAKGTMAAGSDGVAVPQRIDGKSGRAVEFHGDGWISTQHPGITGDRDRTVACWIRLPKESKQPESAPIIGWGYYKKKRDKSGRLRAGKSWMMKVTGYLKKRPHLTGVLSVDLGGEQFLGSTNLRDGQWHHVAAVAMAVDHGSAILLYVDGRLEQSSHEVVGTMDTASSPEVARTVQFGRNLFTKRMLLRGALDEFYLFGGALSGDEIRRLMQSENPE